jgi:hypothetical protein
LKELCFALIFTFFITTLAISQETLIIAGAGPSMKIVELFFQNFAKQPAARGYTFVVPQVSTKHAGGIKHSFNNLFGRTGRPLNDQEVLFNREQIFLAMMPIAFAAGREVGINRLSMRELEMIFQKKITNWKTVGGPDAKITTIGREPTEALFSELKRDYNFFKHATFDIIFEKDHEVINFLNSPRGWYAVAFGAKANLSHFNEIEITEDLRSGVRVGLVYDRNNRAHPLIEAVTEYTRSDEWRGLVRRSGAYPLK